MYTWAKASIASASLGSAPIAIRSGLPFQSEAEAEAELSIATSFLEALHVVRGCAADPRSHVTVTADCH